MKAISKVLDIDLGRKHFLRSIISLLPPNISEQIADAAPDILTIDSYYISTRYPDFFEDEISPYRAFSEREAIKAIDIAASVVKVSRLIIDEISNPSSTSTPQ